MFSYIKIPNYFFEIKVRIMHSILLFFLILYFSFQYKETLVYLLTKECFIIKSQVKPYFIYTNLTEVFYAYVNLGILTAFYLVIPYFIIQCWFFINPGLYRFEYTRVKRGLIFFLLNYTFITLLTHYFLLPFIWYFFSGFELISSNNAIGIYFEAKLEEYIKLVYQLYFVIGFYSQFCLISMIILLYFFHNNLKFIRQSRSPIYFIIFLFASLITPPDISSQLFIAIPFLVCYEATLFLYVFFDEYGIYSKKTRSEKNGI